MILWDTSEIQFSTLKIPTQMKGYQKKVSKCMNGLPIQINGLGKLSNRKGNKNWELVQSGDDPPYP